MVCIILEYYLDAMWRVAPKDGKRINENIDFPATSSLFIYGSRGYWK